MEKDTNNTSKNYFKELQSLSVEKKTFYKLSKEYKTLCEQEIQNNQLLISEVERLTTELSLKSLELIEKDKKIAQLLSKLEEHNDYHEFKTANSTLLQCRFESFYNKLKLNQQLELMFIDKLGDWANLINNFSIEKIIIKILDFFEELLPNIRVQMHRKNYSYDESNMNPAFSQKKNKVAAEKPQNENTISERVENPVKKEAIGVTGITEIDMIMNRRSSELGGKHCPPKLRLYKRY